MLVGHLIALPRDKPFAAKTGTQNEVFSTAWVARVKLLEQETPWPLDRLLHLEHFVLRNTSSGLDEVR
jgi:hypothetical protein